MELHCNGNKRKLEFRGVRRYRRGREKNREAEKRGNRKAR